MAKRKKSKVKKKKSEQPVKVESPPSAKPAAGVAPKSAEFEELVEQGQQGGGDREKPRPGRPPKKQGPETMPEPEKSLQLTIKALEAAVKIPFNLWSEANKLPALKLLDKETQELAEASKNLLDYYCPDIPVPVIIWSNLTLTLAAIVGPRIQQINKIKEAKKAAEAGTVAAKGPGRVPAAGKTTFPTEQEIKKGDAA